MKYTILVVDDEAVERLALSQLLKKEFPNQVTVRSLSSGMEMLEYLKQNTADIAIVDISMPGMTGIETIRFLREQGNGMKIIINTAYSDFQYAVDAIKLEVDDYLVKPLIREKICETIRGCMDKIQMERRKNEESQRMLSAMKPAIADSLLRAVADGQVNSEVWDTYTGAMGISPHQMVIVLIAFGVDKWQPADWQPVLAYLNRTISSEFECILSRHDANSISMMVSAQPNQYYLSFMEELSTKLRFVQKMLRELFQLSGRIAVGPKTEHVMGLHDSYLGAKTLLENGNDAELCFYERMKLDNKADAQTQGDSWRRIVRIACKVVRDQYTKDISLDTVAMNVGVSSSYLSRVFKQETGVNFHEYLTDVRMEAATKLLRRESLSIRELAQRVGYQNHTYFCKVFKAKTGKTVNEYRESIQKEKT